MTNRKLYLIGTIHLDPDGRERLDHILERLSPSIIALEFNKNKEESYNSLQYSQRIERKICSLARRAGFTSKEISNFIEDDKKLRKSTNFEYSSCKSYEEKNSSSELCYIDLESCIDKSRAPDQYFEDFIRSLLKNKGRKKRFLERMNNPTRYEEHEKELRETFKVLYKNPKCLSKEYMDKCNSSPDEIYNLKRDENMEKKIRRLYNGSRLVSIVGLSHLLGLKERLSDLNPTAMTLADYKSIK